MLGRVTQDTTESLFLNSDLYGTLEMWIKKNTYIWMNGHKNNVNVSVKDHGTKEEKNQLSLKG